MDSKEGIKEKKTKTPHNGWGKSTGSLRVTSRSSVELSLRKGEKKTLKKKEEM